MCRSSSDGTNERYKELIVFVGVVLFLEQQLEAASISCDLTSSLTSNVTKQQQQEENVRSR